MAVLTGLADRFEPWGMDEASLDISSRVRNREEARRLTLEIKKETYEK